MSGEGISRRGLLLATAVAASPITSTPPAPPSHDIPWQPGAADHPRAADPRPGYIFFTADEAAFIEAATDRLIPPDEHGPGAKETGVPIFLDRQLAGDYGKGGHFYMQGPWPAGTPTQGYQSRLAPADFYRAAIASIADFIRQQNNGATFAALPAASQDAFLSSLEDGSAALKDINAKDFFKLFLQNTLEGFFSDPLYGGNRDMAGWKLIGFPGARYNYLPYVKRHGEALNLPPVSLLGRPDWSRT